NYEVKSVLVVKAGALFEWRLACLDETRGEWLVAKISDNTISLYGYSEGTWTPAGREELIKDAAFIFQAPKDENNYKANELNYAAEIAFTDPTTQKEFVYAQKEQGELTGNA